MVHNGFPWKPEEFGPLLLCGDYKVEGLQNQNHTYGLGVPLIVNRAEDSAARRNTITIPNRSVSPATAFFRFQGGLAELGEHRTGRAGTVQSAHHSSDPVHGRSVPLETDLTTPLAYYLANTKLAGPGISWLPARRFLQRRLHHSHA